MWEGNIEIMEAEQATLVSNKQISKYLQRNVKQDDFFCSCLILSN